MVYEAGDLLGFQIHLFIGQKFVVPSLNVAIKTNLGFIPFLILCHNIEKLCHDIFFEIN